MAFSRLLKTSTITSAQLKTIDHKLVRNITEGDAGFLVDDQRDGWLKAHLIPSKALHRCTADARDEALRSLAETAQDQIRTLRKKGDTYREGRVHGFWVQQFANARLALAEFE